MICKHFGNNMKQDFAPVKTKNFSHFCFFFSPSFFPIVLEVVSMCLSVRGVKIYYDFLPPT